MARQKLHPVEATGASAAPASGRSLAYSLVVSLRPGQWTKNLIIFAGLLFSRHLFEPVYFARTTGAFLIFCALSGVIYLVNDVLDREADRRHPSKARRPIASGAVSPNQALATAAILTVLSLAAAWWLGPGFFVVAVGYVVLLALYSGVLKRLVILDVLTIAIGFVLRAVAGAVVIDVPISPWLLICTVLLALFLALAKRRHELTLLAEGATGHRHILREYSPYLLDQMISVVTASTLVSYAFYTVSPDTIDKFGTDRLLLTIPFPLYGIFRYLYLVHQRQAGGSPSEILLTDRPLLVCVALWAAAVILIVYPPLSW